MKTQNTKTFQYTNLYNALPSDQVFHFLPLTSKFWQKFSIFKKVALAVCRHRGRLGYD